MQIYNVQQAYSFLTEVCFAVQIRSKALVQYTTPFTSVNLLTMAEAFKTDVRWGLAVGSSHAHRSRLMSDGSSFSVLL